MEQHWFPTLDFQAPALDDLCEGVRVVEGARALNHSVYVHCKAGKGRSATMVAAFLIKVLKLLQKTQKVSIILSTCTQLCKHEMRYLSNY